MARRIAARVVTGRAAFLIAGVADLAVVGARVGWAKARRRDPWR